MKKFYPVLKLAVVAAVAITLPACATSKSECPLMKKSCPANSAECAKAKKDCPKSKAADCCAKKCDKKKAQ